MKHTLELAREEILSLRRRNEILSAKVEVMELFALALNTRPAYPTQGMGEDAVYYLQKKLDEIRDVEMAQQEAASQVAGCATGSPARR